MLLKVYKEPVNQKQPVRTVTDTLMCQQHCSYFNCNWVDKEPLTRLDVGQMPYSSFFWKPDSEACVDGALCRFL